MVCRVDGGTITLTGMVGDNYWEDGFTSGDVVMALAQVGAGNPVKVILNSGGGYATEGSAIYSALKGHDGPVTMVIQGIAASAASLIAMAGDEVVMSIGAVMMIHDPATITWGTAADHQVSINMLNALANTYAGVYAAKTKGTNEQMRAFMRDELWMEPADAVAKGFADKVEDASNDNTPVQASAFAYGVYAKAPEPLRALASAKGWKPRGPTMTAPPVQPPQPKAETPPEEPTMSTQNQTPGDAVAAATARIKGIMQHEEASGRTTLAEHLAYETTMSVDEAVAALKASAKAEAPGEVESFEERKARMQGDGLGLPGQPPTVKAEKAEKAKAGWGNVVAKHNKAVEARRR